MFLFQILHVLAAATPNFDCDYKLPGKHIISRTAPTERYPQGGYHGEDFSENGVASLEECAERCRTDTSYDSGCVAFVWCPVGSKCTESLDHSVSTCWYKYDLGYTWQIIERLGTENRISGFRCDYDPKMWVDPTLPVEAEDSKTTAEDPAESDCPSSECWTFDAETRTCSLIPNKCVSLSCEATSMHIKMSSGVFGATPEIAASATKDLNLDQTSVEINGVTFNDGFTKVCQLDGDCDLSYEIAKEKLIFTQTMVSNVEPETLQVGDLTLELSKSKDATLSFQCEYGTSVSVTSTQYSIQDVQSSGNLVGIGTLDAGFSITLGSDNVNIGDYQSVSINWAVKSLTDVKFYVSKCDVINDQTNISIIKNGCISSVIVKGDSYAASVSEISFDYKTFKVRGASVTEQTLKCYLIICTDDCKQPTRDDQCDQNSPFSYTIGPLYD